METDKKKAVTAIFLETFVAKGLGETTSRDLAKALNLQSGGLYYYFESKDAAIVACAEEAMARLEQELIVPALEEVAFPDKMISNTKKRAKALAPTMGFLTQVCASPKFGPLMKDRVEALFDRYDYYAAKVAEKLGCCHESAASCVYMGMLLLSHYLLFGEQEHITVQAAVFKNQLNQLVNNETHLR